MNVSFFLALVTSVIGFTPFAILSTRSRFFFFMGNIGSFGIWWVYYVTMPSLVWPLYGAVGITVVALWIFTFVLKLLLDESNEGYETYPHRETRRNIAFGLLASCGVIVLVGYTALSTGSIFHSSEYAQMIGHVEQRKWTQDVQPKDPRHVRLVPKELAFYLATKQLGEAPGAIGSQFEISWDHLTLQMVKEELWYVGPLDFKGYAAWQTADTAPGYVMVHGEDPKRPVIVKADEKFTYMPGAFFAGNLKRHIWSQNPHVGLTDYSFEVDDEKGDAHWVVTTFKPTIGFSGCVVTGVIVVDPTTGVQRAYKKGEIPSFIERVIPSKYVESYIDSRGKYGLGWVNSWWGKKDLTEGETPTLSFGSDGNPYWVTSITSANRKDDSLVGLMYTHTRTGQSILYHAVGGTEEAVLDLVNNKVSYRKLHGADPVLYNVYGTMTSIVPLLGESHSPQGVAFVDVANMQIAVGDNVEGAINQYQRMLATSGRTAPEKERQVKELPGIVDRFSLEVRSGETTYYLHIEGFPHILSGGGEISPTLLLTKIGDEVIVGFIESGESTVPMVSFENRTLLLDESTLQREMREQAEDRKKAEIERERTARAQ